MAALLVFASVFLAVLPMVAFLALVWWLDRYDREPLWLFGLTFLWGGVGGVIFGVMGSDVLLRLFSWLPVDPEVLGAVIVAPLAEEPAKALFLLFVLWNRHFDNMTDGFVYGAAAGLGFGMTENLLYFSSVAGSTAYMPAAEGLATYGMTVLIRTFYSAAMHATATSVVGASLGLARFRGCRALVVAGVVGMGMAMGIHALWNGLLTLDEVMGGDGRFATASFVLFPLELLMAFMVFQGCLLGESLSLKRELEGDDDVPAGHGRIVSSWFRRMGSAWVPKGVDRKAYIQVLTALGMRKRQARLARGADSTFYRDEVVRLRRRLRRLRGLDPDGRD